MSNKLFNPLAKFAFAMLDLAKFVRDRINLLVSLIGWSRPTPVPRLDEHGALRQMAKRLLCMPFTIRLGGKFEL